MERLSRKKLTGRYEKRMREIEYFKLIKEMLLSSRNCAMSQYLIHIQHVKDIVSIYPKN